MFFFLSFYNKIMNTHKYKCNLSIYGQLRLNPWQFKIWTYLYSRALFNCIYGQTKYSTLFFIIPKGTFVYIYPKHKRKYVVNAPGGSFASLTIYLGVSLNFLRLLCFLLLALNSNSKKCILARKTPLKRRKTILK